jgi:hypothetical protein
MYTRFIAPLCCAAAVAFACGPRSPSSAIAFAVPVKKRAVTVADGPTVTSTLKVRVEKSVALSLQVTNASGKRTEINFPNGQMYDFRVVDSTGREVWRWSEGRLFTQSLQNRLLDAGETLTFEERWVAPESHGEFTAVATLMSDNHPIEVRANFVVP